VPPIQGGKSIITVTGEVGSGIVKPTLEKNNHKNKKEAGVLYLICKSATDNDEYAKVEYEESLKSQKEYHQVRVDDANGKEMAKIKVVFAKSLTETH
jgi:uncharacterized protein YcfJ